MHLLRQGAIDLGSLHHFKLKPLAAPTSFSDSDLWLLRHDTTYADVHFNGTKMPLLKFHVSEIHSQTRKQQSVNNTGPMVSLIHGLPDFIPGGCTCVADPVGVPDVAFTRTSGLDNDEMEASTSPRCLHTDPPAPSPPA